MKVSRNNLERVCISVGGTDWSKFHAIVKKHYPGQNRSSMLREYIARLVDVWEAEDAKEGRAVDGCR